MNPQARSSDLVVEPIGEELLVFDNTSQRAHSLNAIAATVWSACDGTRNVAALMEHTGLSEDVIEIALRELAGCDLLTGLAAAESSPQPVSRRAALRKAALTGAGIGIALPVIRSIVAPSSALAGSQSCTAQTCASGSHCHSTAVGGDQTGPGACTSLACVSNSASFTGASECASHPCCYPRVCFYSNGVHTNLTCISL
jgi:hypothetical protein